MWYNYKYALALTNSPNLVHLYIANAMKTKERKFKHDIVINSIMFLDCWYIYLASDQWNLTIAFQRCVGK